MWHHLHQFYSAEHLGVAYTCTALATSFHGLLFYVYTMQLFCVPGVWHHLHQVYSAEHLGVAYTCRALATTLRGIVLSHQNYP